MPEEVFGRKWKGNYYNHNRCYFRECNNHESPMYVSDGYTCLVFRNSCHLKNENCRRLHNYSRSNKKYISHYAEN